jgi:hypothetical protein
MFHRSLREFGTDVIGLFNDELHDQTKQFVVAVLVSVREIETTDLSIITAANLKFQSLCGSGREFKLDRYYMLFSRLVVLLNLPEPCTHGEKNNRALTSIQIIHASSCVNLYFVPFLTIFRKYIVTLQLII